MASNSGSEYHADDANIRWEHILSLSIWYAA